MVIRIQLSIHLYTGWPSAAIYPHAGCPSAANYPSAAIYPHAGRPSAAIYPSAANYPHAGCPSAANCPSAAIYPSAANYPLQPYIRMLDVHLIVELHSSAIELAAVDDEVFWVLRRRWMAWT